jgi:hypothetical protein
MVSTRLLPVLLGSVACGLTVSDRSLIDDVAVLAIVAEPPESELGMRTDITAHIGDPYGETLDVMVWFCAVTTEGCLERVRGSIDEWVSVGPAVDGLYAVSLPSPLADTTVWTLACRQDACPIIHMIAGLDPSEPAPEDVAQMLADPASWLGTHPIDGVSIAARSLPMRDGPDKGNVNPRVRPEFDGVVAAGVGTSSGYEFAITDGNGDPAVAYAYTTIGSFPDPSKSVQRSQVKFDWLSSDVPGTGRAWVVIDDERGGVAVWRSDAFSGMPAPAIGGAGPVVGD